MKQDRRYKTKTVNSEKNFKVLFQTNQRAETNKTPYSKVGVVLIRQSCRDFKI